ncbi:MAG: hypothetical protein LC731_02255, partial [Acidobacteria bacterium]|nr:hypothetical protein [Acidobacteriota bacterium]
MLKPSYTSTLLSAALLLLLALASFTQVFAQGSAAGQTTAAAATPSEAVRQFYKALGEKRFRDALMATALKPAIENLSAAEFEELRPDFERMAVDADKVQLAGEQISGDRASVFVKLASDGPGDPPVEVQLRRAGGNWILIFNEEVE